MQGYSEPKNGAALVRESQVHEQVMCLDKNLCELAGVVDDLERLLLSVLREEKDTVCGECSPEQILVPHADFLRNAQRRVYHTTDRLRSVLNRLEL